ncbi:hypothetical protein ACFX2C_017861 [Malus domestica]|uniref:RING-type E3 ubiquitin transferase n=1 Tax=Malus domestica TaxID=3750 RepID=A0A498HWV2_MALDO|nr:hypothetical protein DVH24_029345 [Malus domestica]
MGTISNPIRRTASHAIDMYFDLDEALTLPPEDHICYRGNNYNIATSTAYTLAANMPTAVGAEEVNEGVICSICAVCFHHGYSDHDHEFAAKQVPCRHVYHQTCIANWLSNSNSCPLCRSTIIPIDRRPITN